MASADRNLFVFEIHVVFFSNELVHNLNSYLWEVFLFYFLAYHPTSSRGESSGPGAPVKDTLSIMHFSRSSKHILLLSNRNIRKDNDEGDIELESAFNPKTLEESERGK